ncbi:ABC transporter permease [Patescibacteria group bacterium]
MIILRSQTAISIPFLNDMTSGTIAELFISPLRDHEFLIGMMIVSFIKLLGTILVLFLLSYLLFSFNIFKMGFYLIPFITMLLIMGWSLAILANSFLIRFHGKIIFITWFFSYAIQPVSCTFYSCSVLPNPLRTIASFVPASYIFEGMREVVFKNHFNPNYLIYSGLLNVLYLAFAFSFFKFMSWWSRKSGALAASLK